MQTAGASFELIEYLFRNLVVNLRVIDERADFAFGHADAVQVAGKSSVEIQPALRTIFVAVFGFRAARGAVEV